MNAAALSYTLRSLEGFMGEVRTGTGVGFRGIGLPFALLVCTGADLWSRRFGGPGVTFASQRVSTSAAGDVYLLTGSTSAVDLGGGAILGYPIVASFSPSGAHRWSRAFTIAGSYQMGIDGCGALVITSSDPSFDPGCGKVIPPPTDPWLVPPNLAVARFAP